MDLLVFAHRGEAQSFIKHHKFQDENLYRGVTYCVLITGEGIWEATKLGRYLSDIDRVINLGIAGALTRDLKLEEIYPIRTHYLYEYEKPQFKSFSNELDGQLDCITCLDRILDDKLANTLSNFAQIVDREAWMLAKISQDAGIPFESYKLISDYAGRETACFDIKEKAKEYSDTLFDYYQSLSKPNIEENPIDLPFECSFTQKKRILKLIGSLQKKFHNDLTFYTERLGFPKDKKAVNQFIEKLEKELNPLLSQINERLVAIEKPFNDIGAQLSFDPKLEKKKFRLSMEINDARNIEKLVSVLKDFNYSEIDNLWNGDV